MNRAMRRTLLLAASTLLSAHALAMACSPPLPIVSNQDFSLEVLVDGRPRPEYAARGARYIEALAGREYAIRLTNRTPERIAVALSVDGLNSIDAKTTTMQDASKWILDPYQTITIDGWQTGSQTARKFFFTSEERSYGHWLGNTDNLGVISAAFFRERQRPLAKLEQRRDQGAAAEMEAPAPSARAEAKRQNSVVESDDLAATGIGRELTHEVERVSFDSEELPAVVVALRYEYRPALVKLGVLPSPERDRQLLRRERARGFSDQGFAPDPYARR